MNPIMIGKLETERQTDRTTMLARQFKDLYELKAKFYPAIRITKKLHTSI